MLPVYPVARAESRLWVYRIERDWCVLIDQIKGNAESKEADAARKELKESLISIATIFDDMPYLSLIHI